MPFGEYMKKLYFYLLLACLSVNLQGQSHSHFKKFQVEDGLSHNTVWCVMQDSYGFMWFGTSDGLNRFDGKKFKIYRNDYNDKFSLGNNSAQTLFEDDKTNIWVGTSKGIYIYDRISEKFNQFSKQTEYGVSISSDIKKIIKSEKNQIWIATLGQGIFIYDTENDKLTQNSQYASFSWDICEDASHWIYASSLQEGVICFDQNGKYIESYTSMLETKSSGTSRINCISSINNKIWFSVGSSKIGMLDTKTKEIEYYSETGQNIGAIKCIEEFSEKELLLGSDNGLYLFNTLNKSFTRIDNPSDPRGLSDQTINSILKDAEGGFWITTYLGGVNYLAQQSKTFEYYYPSYMGQSTGKVINQFCEDKDRNIWIGTQDGLKFFNTKSNTIEHYILPGKDQKYDIRSLLLDGDKLWIGTFGDGLKVLDLRTRHMEEYYHLRESAQTICSNDVLSLYKDSEENIFVGTSWGLCKYNRETNNFTTLSFVGTMISVFDMKENRYGDLWVGTYNSGAFRINVRYNSIWKPFSHEQGKANTLTNNSVISIHEDSNGVMWLGTNGGGLCYFDKDKEEFINFDPQNKILPNNVIYSIEEDNLGFLWISTNAGLLRVHPADKTKAKLYTREDGLQSNQFNFKASLKASTGKLYFGGINGFNSFSPDEFKDNEYIPPVYITNIRLNNANENESNNLMQLSSPIYTTKELKLPFDQNNLSFEFAALSYEESHKNKYSYRLEGFDKEWIQNGNSEIASYTNLPPGEYTFKVMGSNNDGKWNEEGATINITILPPWWRSNLAYGIYFILIGILIYMFMKYWTRRTRKKFDVQMEEYQIKKEKEVYQSKINFFINLVHEIRTPLSLINLPLEKLSETRFDTPQASRYLSIINKNVNYLLSVVNQLLDFQKIENNKESKINIKDHNINILLQSIYEQFISFAELKNIKMTISLPSENHIIKVDADILSKIIFNLLGNAIKYADKRIDLKFESYDNYSEISVADDGPGIPDNEKEKIFEAFYQLNEESNTGTGIGLAFSKLLAENHGGSLSIDKSEWNGAVFKLTIPNDLKNADVETENILNDNIVETSEVNDNNETGNLAYKQCKVLLVEDNVELQILVEESLSAHFTILKAGNGKEALRILDKETIDIVVSDVMMPVMDGFELTKTIKSDLNYSHIPIILLTAKVTTDAKIEGMEYGADVYLEKPFSIKHLQKQIENLLKLRLSFQQMMSTLPMVATTTFTISKKDSEFLEKLHIEVDKHLDELDFSIDNLAETMFMSRSNFYRKIKGISGMAPNDYLKTIRLNKAAEMLLHEGCSITEIYERVGFNSSSYFAKCFKAQFGVLPKDYVAHKMNSAPKNSQ